tara:strand:+ start:754 stop:1173 length:420 start_codon:yes stop_codon:yes gene_type:complete
MITVTKTITFAAAHRLVGHTKCGNLHGHTWHVDVEVGGESGADGMVVDFAAVKGRLGTWIEKYLDHAVLLDHADVEAQNALRPLKGRVFLMDGPPTAETVALRLFEQASSYRFRVRSVTVWESPTARACVSSSSGADHA